MFKKIIYILPIISIFLLSSCTNKLQNNQNTTTTHSPQQVIDPAQPAGQSATSKSNNNTPTPSDNIDLDNMSQSQLLDSLQQISDDSFNSQIQQMEDQLN